MIGSSPSGAVGIAKEVGALSAAIAKLKENSSPASLFSLVAAEAVTKAELEALPSGTAEMLNLVKRSIATVAAASPIESAAYGQFLVEVATTVAAASKEGGFLGLGGTRINDAERAAIDQIKSAVGASAGLRT